MGDRRTASLCAGMIAGTLVLSGEKEAARPYFEEALRLSASIGDAVHEALHATAVGMKVVAVGHVDSLRAPRDRVVV